MQKLRLFPGRLQVLPCCVTFAAISAAVVTASAAGHKAIRAPHGMVASANPYASRAGLDALKKGGNAVDAAAVIAMALAVTHPTAGNLGGGGFMLIRTADGRSTFIDFREKAPGKAERNMYLGTDGKVVPELSRTGVKSAGVPGTVAGVALALRKYGTISFADACRPAERLARKGVVLSKYEADSIRAEADKLSRFIGSRRIFLRDGNFYREGELFRQPELAATFRRLMKHGPREFYDGETARLIVKTMGGEGFISLADLRDYRPVERQPLVGSYRGHTIITAPPPSSGGTALLQMLGMLESYDLKAIGHNSSGNLHLLIEVMRRSFADRADYMGDPDFSTIPVDDLLAKKYIEARRLSIDPERATPSSAVGAGKLREEPDHTTHFSVVDAAGNMVACTYTINDNFGSGVTVEGAGFLLNDEMDDFTSKLGVPNLFGLVQGEANSILPGKRPLSSMTPTIVLREGKPYFAVGSPGGPRIISTVLQTVLNVVDFRMDIQQALDMPRIHHQWLPDEVVTEPFGLSADTGQALMSRGHRFAERMRHIGNGQGVMIEPQTGMRLGGTDPRGDGLAVGY